MDPDLQIDRLEETLAHLGIPARVVGGEVTPRLVRYQLTMPPGAEVQAGSSQAEELARSLGAPSCRIYCQGGKLQVEVVRNDAQAVSLLELCRRLVLEGPQGPETVPPATAVLGLGPEGTPLLLRLPSPHVGHVLLIGTTGAGKTALARAMVASLALHNQPRDLQVVLVDPTGRGFAPFEGLPHLVGPVVTRVEEALPLLARLVDERGQRSAGGRDTPRLVVVLDKLADLVPALSRSSARGAVGREVVELLTRLAQQGREVGLHLVACIQDTAMPAIAELLGHVPIRLVGAVANAADAQAATGLAGTGAEHLLGQGDFLVVARGQAARMQAAYIGEGAVQELVAQLRAGERPQLPPATDIDGDNGAGLAARLRTRLRRIK